MRRSKIRLVGIGLMAGVAMLAVQAGAALLAYDGFDTSAAGAAANGIYKTDISFTNSANTTVAGGNMVGFQASDAWTAGGSHAQFMMPMNGKGGQNIVINDSSEVVYRKSTANLSGKTVAWQSATMSIDYPYGSTYNPIAVAGYGRENTLYRVGAYVGFRWDGSNWDLVARYRNTSGSAVWNVAVQDLGTTVGDTFLVWKMDDANDELSIWVNPTSVNDPATTVFTDYNNTVADVSYANIYSYRLGRNSSGSSHAFLVDDMKLGETMQDVIPEPAALGLLAMVAGGALFIRRQFMM